MKLLTKELKKRFKEVGLQGDVDDPIVICKFFHPASSWTWFAYSAEYMTPEGKIKTLEPDDDDTQGDVTFFGWVYGDFSELGYFSLREMEGVQVMGLGIERDLHWKETPLSEVQDEYTPVSRNQVIVREEEPLS